MRENFFLEKLEKLVQDSLKHDFQKSQSTTIFVYKDYAYCLHTLGTITKFTKTIGVVKNIVKFCLQKSGHNSIS